MSQPSKSFTRRRYPIAAGKVINPGDTVGIITGGGTSSGYASPGAHVTTLRAKGIAQAFYDAAGNMLTKGDNTSGADGDLFVEVAMSISRDGGVVSYRRANDTAGTPLTQADCGSNVYILDATTMTAASSGNSRGGELDEINADGTLQIIFPISY